MTTIIGVSGRKYHGKDSFSKAVVTASSQTSSAFTMTHFADELKDQAIQIFGIDRSQAYDTEAKEKPFDSPLSMDAYVDAMKKVTGLEIKPAGLTATTPRELLQYYGTEYVRAAQDDYWIRRTLDQDWNRVLIADTRFPNEAEAIRKLGGKIIKVVRVDMPVSNDEHVSETGVDLIKPDFELHTRTGDFTRIVRMAKAVAIEDWFLVKDLAETFKAVDTLIDYSEESYLDERVLLDAVDLLEFMDELEVRVILGDVK